MQGKSIGFESMLLPEKGIAGKHEIPIELIPYARSSSSVLPDFACPPNSDSPENTCFGTPYRHGLYENQMQSAGV